ncbi:MAG: formylglycine-generating enzyme family protein [Spirochaetota bacterium]
MVHIDGGAFVMGSGSQNDNPPHEVVLASFEMAEREITVGEFREFTDSEDIPFDWTSYDFMQHIRRRAGATVPDSYAMYYITWYEAVWYANWRSHKDGLVPVYRFDEQDLRAYLYDYVEGMSPPRVVWDRSASGYRLPTEAEWEFAATNRGLWTQHTDEELLEVAWLRENADFRVHSVRKRQPSQLGLYDVLGNVSEWCWDYYGSEYYSSSPLNDPTGPPRGTETPFFPGRRDIRVVRGCSWMASVSSCNPRARMLTIAARRSIIGIRLVRNAE